MSILPEHLNVLKKSKKSVKDYTKGIELKDSWGTSSDDFIPSDLSQHYMLTLLQDKKEETGKHHAMTAPFAVDAKEKNPNHINSIEYNSKLLASKYIENLHKQVNGVYSIINLHGLDKEDGKDYNHQNWLYLDINSRKLIRFEPSEEFEDIFRTGEFCNLVIEELIRYTKQRWTYEIAKDGLGVNQFSGCRALSTLLASLHLKGISFDNLKNIKQKSLLKPFTYLMQQEMTQKCVGIKNLMPRSSRRNPLPFIVL